MDKIKHLFKTTTIFSISLCSWREKVQFDPIFIILVPVF